MSSTPAMKQFMEIKAQHKDAIVLFRMGDFYETFYEDAKKAASLLDITLTRRGMRNTGESIPLAGIPYHALDSYLGKLIRQGQRVVIVEQLEDPKYAKGLVKRGIVRIVSPGTVTEEYLLPKQNNYLAAVVKEGNRYGVGFVDVSTGDFLTAELNGFEDLLSELTKFTPSEILLPMSSETTKQFSQLREAGYLVYSISDVSYYIGNAQKALKEHYGSLTLESTGLKGKDLCISACGAALSYLHEMQRGGLSHLKPVKHYLPESFMLLDAVTIRNLEILKTMKDGSEKHSVLGILDRSCTNMGGRMVRQAIQKPLVDIKEINYRLNAVAELYASPFMLGELRDLLKNISDFDRLISRANVGNANPRDLVSLHASLEILPAVKKMLGELESSLFERLSHIPEMGELASLLNDSILDDPPANTNEGGFIREGFDSELDRLRNISQNAKRIIRDTEKDEVEKTGIKSLKIRYNKVFGYYIEVTNSNLSSVPEHYIKKQTLVNAERFITPELKELEEQILNAEEKIVSIESRLFQEIIEQVKLRTSEIQQLSQKIGYLDMICSFAEISLKNSYTKPSVSDQYELSLINCRHPVLERLTNFVPNTIEIGRENRMMLITGPNMAGKSVFMRQVAVNIIMAQAGCFVPADHASIGVVDKIFCRTGATDDISQGQSTFMVEMLETAQILNGATSRSFVILDEIGRGTSTYDGVAIAWAVAEHLAQEIKCKSLFATHYHVLNALESKVEGIQNYNIAVEEKDDQMVFLRKILPGGTDKSYGIHVAQLAGMPLSVLTKSREIQFQLENEDSISQKMIVETRKTASKDILRGDYEEVDSLIKTKQLTLKDI